MTLGSTESDSCQEKTGFRRNFAKVIEEAKAPVLMRPGVLPWRPASLEEVKLKVDLE
jgi:hypothetical protein